MQVQTDYETELTLAVYMSADQARGVIRTLRRSGVEAGAIQLTSLGPGTYQCVDRSGGYQLAGALRGTVVGAPIGGLLGLGMAWLVASLSPTPAEVVWLALAGLGAGALVGALLGAERQARYDDDLAQQITILTGSSAFLVRVETPARLTQGVRRALKQAGALAQLDPGAFPESEDQPTLIDKRVA